MNKESKPEFDSYSTTYTNSIDNAVSFAGKEQTFFTERKADYLIKILQSESRDKIKVLDVGCGHGLIHPFIKSQNSIEVDLHAVDMAGEVIEVAKKENKNVAYKIHDGKTLPYENEIFDAVYAICVMHHVPPSQWQSFLSELKRVTKPKGKVIIFEHNPLNPITLKVVNNCPIDKDAVLLKHSKLKILLENCGLTNVKSKSILFTPFSGRLFEKFDESLGWLPLGAQYYCIGHK